MANLQFRLPDQIRYRIPSARERPILKVTLVEENLIAEVSKIFETTK